MTGTPADQSPGTLHASDEPTATPPHASSRKSIGKGAKSIDKGEKSIGKGGHSGTGTTSKKRKRKKSSGSATPAVPSHPSVVEARACTKRQEQAEEARARETVYLTPRAEVVAEETRDATSNAGSSTPRAELVAEETRDATSNAGSSAGTGGTEIVASKREETRSAASDAWSSAGTARTESVTSKVGETGNTAPNAGSCAGDSAIAGRAPGASKAEDTRETAASNTGSSAGDSAPDSVLCSGDSAPDSVLSSGDSALAGSVSRASKVEETRDTVESNTGSSAGDNAPKTAGDAALAGVPRARRPWEWSAKDCDAVLVDVLSRARPEVDFSEGELTEEETSSASSCPDVSVGRGSANRKRRVGGGGSEASNGKDERKAREVSAALNRNNPRMRAARNKRLGRAPPPQTRICIEKVRPSSKGRGTADDEQEARNLSVLLNRNMPRRGTKSPSDDGVRPEGSDTISRGGDWQAAGGGIRCEVGNTGSGSPTPVRTSCVLKGGKGNLCASKGTALGKGSAAEVLWDDRKWYRVTLSSISAEGTHGVLEFLPYRRRNHSREFSSQLELEDWVRAGKLVLPGTHLKWD